jgi:hypothetical protein
MLNLISKLKKKFIRLNKLTNPISKSSSSKQSTNAAFSIASNEYRLTPVRKYVWRASAHNVRSPAVNAAKCSSPSAGAVGSRIISSNWLKIKKKPWNQKQNQQIQHTVEVHMVEVNYFYKT